MAEQVLLNSIKEPLLVLADDHHATKSGGEHYADEERNTQFGMTMKSESHYISCHGITQLVGQRTRTCRRLPSKVILENISGMFNVGINAIMGPSGCGKTSLISILSGRKTKGVSGHVVFSGEIIPDNFRYIVGYVPQDDVISGVLTVQESIMFSAQLRLPRKFSYNDKIQKVKEVISELGLEHCSDSRVGTSLKRGISGGERKRTSIAMELIVSPGIIFLDEPTSGLDAATAISVVQYLHNMSRHDRIIIMSIHQPRYSIFKLFDSVTLLSKGELVYNGPARAVVPYFTNVLGLECSKHNNPADFFLDKITKQEKEYDEEKEEFKKSVSTDREGSHFAAKFRSSNEYAQLQDSLDPIIQTALRHPVVNRPSYATNYFWQVYYLSIRAFKVLTRDPSPYFQVFSTIVLGLITGLLFFQLDTDIQGQRDRAGAIYMSIVNIAVSGVSGIDVFISQRALLVHESTSGFYSIGAHLTAVIFLDLIPLRILPTFLYCPIVYFLSDFRSGAGRFFFFVLTLMLVSFASIAEIFMVSAFFEAFNIANALYLLLLTVSTCFGGFIVTLDSFGDWISWLQYISFVRYGFGAFMWNEFEDTVFCNQLSMSNANNTDICLSEGVLTCCDIIPPNCNLSRTTCGDALLDQIGVDQFEVWWNIVLLGVLGSVFMALSFVALSIATRKK